MRLKVIVRVVIVLTVLAGVGAGGVLWWRERSRFESTDNAFVAAETVAVTPQIEGYVSDVLVGDNETVSAGQVLVRIDPVDVQARLSQAQANVAAAHAQSRSVDDRASLEISVIEERQAALASAEAAAERARLDLDRYATLAGRGYVTQQQLQQARAVNAQAVAAVAQAKASVEAERRTAASLGSSRSQLEAEAASAGAAAEKARIDVQRTEIRAPVGGVVGARSVRAGQFVRPGSEILAIVPLGETFVVANFKETQVARLRIGQPVEIRADAFGGSVIRGHIESFAPATGAEFALIPVENAVGNFTKIAQRLPVRIRVERDSELAEALRPGLSLKVRVDVTVQSGASFAESAVGAPQVASDGRSRAR